MTDTETQTEETPFEWAIVEVFGHRRHAGKASEEERFGSKMLRIDVPTLVIDPVEEGKVMSWSVEKWTTFYYGGASIFSFTPTDEFSAMKANRVYSSPQKYIAAPDDENVNDDGIPF
jgi:hypothetical protein